MSSFDNHALRQHHKASNPVRAFPSRLSDLHTSLPESGETRLWIQGRLTAGGSQLDILDDDNLGQPGEHARLHDDGSPPGGDATPSRLVRRGIGGALESDGSGRPVLDGSRQTNARERSRIEGTQSWRSTCELELSNTTLDQRWPDSGSEGLKRAA